jgi:hypothetical protein
VLCTIFVHGTDEMTHIRDAHLQPTSRSALGLVRITSGGVMSSNLCTPQT